MHRSTPRAWRRGTFYAIVTVIVLGLAGLAWRFARPAPPSVLLITIGGLRADHVASLGANRGAVDLTPNLDRLASNAIVFERAYAQCDDETLSALSLMTSRYVTELIAPTDRVKPARTLAEILAQRGYTTAAVMSSPRFDARQTELTFPRSLSIATGFQHFDAAANGRRTLQQTADAAVDILGQLRGPAFLWVQFDACHYPYEGQGPSMKEQYAATVRAADRATGLVLEAAARRFGTSSIVIVAAEQGELLGEDGAFGIHQGLRSAVMHVPLMISMPGQTPRRSAEVCENVDIVPTVIGALGGVAETWSGRDRRSPAGPTIAISETADLEGQSMTDGRWKLDDHAKPFAFKRARDGSGTLTNRPAPPWAKGSLLFNLKSDPDENAGVSAPDNAEVTLMRQVGKVRTQVEMDQSLRERLMSLGYLQ